MIALLRNIPEAVEKVRSGQWRQITGSQLTGKTVGIIGCGNIGKDLVRLLQPLNCKIMSYDIKNYAEFFHKFKIKAVSLDELLMRSDVITLHLPLNTTTKNMLDAEKLSLINAGAILLNLSRGGLLDEGYLRRMLLQNQLSGAGLDVLNAEPHTEPGLFDLPNVIITPHIGGSSREAILAMGNAAIAGLDDNILP